MKYKAFAKVNIFLKITGTRDNYHTLASRFMVVENLYDTLYFQEKKQKGFEIVGAFDCDPNDNTIYKAYRALLEYTKDTSMEKLMQERSIVVEKTIPAFAGLGGGSSDAATFLHMCNDLLSLGLDTKDRKSVV